MNQLRLALRPVQPIVAGLMVRSSGHRFEDGPASGPAPAPRGP